MRALAAPAVVIGLAAASLLPVDPAAAAAAGAGVRAPTRSGAWTARIVVATHARTRPGHGRVVARVGVTTRWSGAPETLLVLAASRTGSDGRRWLRVRLPARGAGTGWIRADAVVLTRTTWRVEVSLRRRLVVVRRAGHVRWRLRAVIGAPTTPTPTGTFAVAERVRQTDRYGFYGPWVVFLAAFSDAVRWFDGNDGQVGLHGRGGVSLRDPLGTARSHGCLRLSNRAIAIVARHVPEGAPVVISR